MNIFRELMFRDVPFAVLRSKVTTPIDQSIAGAQYDIIVAERDEEKVADFRFYRNNDTDHKVVIKTLGAYDILDFKDMIESFDVTKRDESGTVYCLRGFDFADYYKKHYGGKNGYFKD